MSCTIYFIRHGQSEGNLKRVFLGHTDLDLTPLGYEQAARTAEFLLTKQIDTVYSSDLKRAYNTCNEYLKVSGKTAVKDRRLREIYAGKWENMCFDDIRTSFPESYNLWLEDIGNSHPDCGESPEMLLERVKAAVKDIAASNDGKSVAIFTHATVIRTFFNYAYGNSSKELKDLKWASNASVSSLSVDNGDYRVLSYGYDEFLGDTVSKIPTGV